MKTWDAAIIGLGAMGSASAYHLARGGQTVVGFDRFRPPHNLGSSHGLTRIIREAYFEHPAYVPLVKRSYELWADLERKSDEPLLLKTGGLMIGRPEGALVSGALRSAREHQLAHEVLSAEQVKSRFPALHPEDSMAAVHEPRAGILFPERAIATQLKLAEHRGVELHFEEPVLEWQVEGHGVRLITAKAEYRARRLIISAGPWLSQLVPALSLPLQVERQVLFWFQPKRRGNAPSLKATGDTVKLFGPDKFPIFIFEHEPGHYFYGFPDLGDGIKVAGHHRGIETGPDHVERAVSDGEVKAMRTLLDQYIPEASGELRSTAVCMYTNTPDEHFLVDLHPQHPEVLIVSPCSGHGFKFSPVIGEIVSQIVSGVAVGLPVALFRMQRLLKNQ